MAQAPDSASADTTTMIGEADQDPPTAAQTAAPAATSDAAPPAPLTDGSTPAATAPPSGEPLPSAMPGGAGAPAVSFAAHEDSPKAFSPIATRRGAGAAGAPSTFAADTAAPKVVPVQITPATGDDCGTCAACLDKPKFGGPGIKRKGCTTKRTSAKHCAPVVIESVVKAPALTTPASQRPDNESGQGLSSGEIASSVASTSGGVGSAPPRSSSLGGSSLGPAAATSASGCNSLGSNTASGGGAAGAAYPNPLLGGAMGRPERRVNDPNGGLRERVLRKEYSLRKRGAEAGEQILLENGDANETAANLPSEMMMVVDASAAPAAPAAPSAAAAAATPSSSSCEPMEVEAPAATTASSGPLAHHSSNTSLASSASAASSAAATSADNDTTASSSSFEGATGAPAATDGPSPTLPPREGGSGLTRDEHAASKPQPSSKLPATPMLKTPEIEALAATGDLGVSPLSQFASLLDMTPRLPEQAGGGHSCPGAGSMSPLWQLANLMECTPRLPDEEAAAVRASRGLGSTSRPADPEELADALVNGGLESPAPTDSPGQLRRDLSKALLQAGKLASPKGDGSMPPPPLPYGQQQNNKVRKRKLESDLGLGGGADGGMEYDDDGEERLMLRELLEGDSLGLPLPPHLRPPPKRSKSKVKEKGKPNRCRCDRSGCLKRYCVCFAAGNECAAGECKCKGCENDDSTEERRLKREAAIAEMQKKKSNAFTARIGENGSADGPVHLTGCNCKRSGCQRRYCECFQAGVKCTEKCKCCECKNPAGANPFHRPLPPLEAPKNGSGTQTSSPGGSLVVHLSGNSPRKLQSPAKTASSAAAAPSPTAFVDGALLAAAEAAAADSTGGASRDMSSLLSESPRLPASSSEEDLRCDSELLAANSTTGGGAPGLLVEGKPRPPSILLGEDALGGVDGSATSGSTRGPPSLVSQCSTATGVSPHFGTSDTPMLDATSQGGKGLTAPPADVAMADASSEGRVSAGPSPPALSTQPPPALVV